MRSGASRCVERLTCSRSDPLAYFLRIVIPAKAGMTKVTDMARERIPCVYILASGPRGTLYIGVTSDLPGRIWQHKNDQADGFTKRYRIHTLVWYEVHEEMESAILREKALKAWKRLWKIELIESMNPEWRDLYQDLLG